MLVGTALLFAVVPARWGALAAGLTTVARVPTELGFARLMGDRADASAMAAVVYLASLPAAATAGRRSPCRVACSNAYASWSTLQSSR